jgi:hypothetical protein
MASTGVDPRTLCLEFDIHHTTLRAIQSGYANYKRYGGNEKIWTRYFEQHAHARPPPPDGSRRIALPYLVLGIIGRPGDYRSGGEWADTGC